MLLHEKMLWGIFIKTVILFADEKFLGISVQKIIVIYKQVRPTQNTDDHFVMKYWYKYAKL